MKCHYTKYKGERVFIPGCMGAAVYGKHRCTCAKEEDKKMYQMNKKEILWTIEGVFARLEIVMEWIINDVPMSAVYGPKSLVALNCLVKSRGFLKEIFPKAVVKKSVKDDMIKESREYDSIPKYIRDMAFMIDDLPDQNMLEDKHQFIPAAYISMIEAALILENEYWNSNY